MLNKRMKELIIERLKTAEFLILEDIDIEYNEGRKSVLQWILRMNEYDRKNKRIRRK